MKWFVQLYRWRATCSTIWLCLLTFPVLLVYGAVSTLSPLHPLLWVSECAHKLASISSLFLCCLYLSTLVLVMMMYTVTATVDIPVYRTRLHMLWSVVTPTHLLWVIMLGFLGGVKGHCLSQLSGYVTMYGSGHLSEEWLFITAHGAFTALCYGLRYFTHKELVLVLPSVQQSPLFSLRGHVMSHMREGLLYTLRDLRWFYPIYFLTRSYLRSKVTNIFASQWGALVGLLNVELLLQVLLMGTLSHALCSFGLRVFRVYQSQAIQFPVLAMFSSQSNRLLTDALKSKLPLLKHLAFLDLCALAWQPGSRRTQIYSLDRTGQPKVWNDVCEQCLAVINTLTHKLTGGKPPSIVMPTKASAVSEVKGSRGWWSPESSLLNRRTVGERRAQLWSYSPPSQPLTQPAVTSEKTPSLWGTMMLREVMVYMRSLPSVLAQGLKRKPFFVYFLSSLPGTEEQMLYLNTQLTVWAVTGVSELAVCSYTEDQYGVVQRSLSQVLGSLINLSQALDKHLKIPLSSTPSTRNTLLALERNGKYAIKTAVLTSLHRLEMTFSREKRVFQLSDQQLKYWTSHSKL